MKQFYTFRPLFCILFFFICATLSAQGDSVTLVAANETTELSSEPASEDLDVLYQEFGTGTIQHGIAQVKLDPEIARNFIKRTDNPVKVYIKLHGDSEGVFLSNVSNNGFTIKELNNGTSNLKFSWHMVATAPVQN